MRVTAILCLFFLFVPKISDGNPGVQNWLIAGKNSLSQIFLDTNDYIEKDIPLDNVKYAGDVDFDISSGYLYWTDEGNQVIERAKLNGSDRRVLWHARYPTSIAIDWIAKNLYWTFNSKHIDVSRLDATSRKTVLYIDLNPPQSICVDPAAGYMYWVVWSQKTTVIERAFLDGSHREVLVTDELDWTSGLTLDLEERRMYWCDARTGRIEVSGMDGSARRILVSGLYTVVGITLVGDYIYWTNESNIERANKHTGKERMFIEHKQDVTAIKAIGFNQHNGTNTCGQNNGNCSHLCLFRPPPLSRVCACPLHYELKTDEITCVLADSFLVFATDTNFIAMSSLLPSNNHNYSIIVSGLKMDTVNAIDFDARGDRVYWSDESSIYRAFFNGSEIQQIVQSKKWAIYDIAVDWLAGNIYWVNIKLNCIAVARLDGSSQKTLVRDRDFKLRKIVLDPHQGYMYWMKEVEGTDGNVVIERGNLDGTNRRVLAQRHDAFGGIGWSLTLDYQDRRLYWGKIYSTFSSKLDGSDIRTLVDSTKNAFDGFLSQYGEFLYWTDQSMRMIVRGNKKAIKDYYVILNDIGTLTAFRIFSYKRHYSIGKSTCAKNNGGCSHLCFANPKRNSSRKPHHCACPKHFTLNRDGRTCFGPSEYILVSTGNAITRVVSNPDTDSNAAAITQAMLSIDDMNNATVLAFDPLDKFILFGWIT